MFGITEFEEHIEDEALKAQAEEHGESVNQNGDRLYFTRVLFFTVIYSRVILES